MSLTDIVIVSMFVAYLWTGWEMVQYHSSSSPIDRAAYVRKGFAIKSLVALIWPYVAMRGRELAWFTATCASSAVLVGIALYFLRPMGVPVWLIVGVIPVLRMLPIVGLVLNIPVAVVATLAFFVLFRPFGAKIPSGMERAARNF